MLSKPSSLRRIVLTDYDRVYYDFRLYVNKVESRIFNLSKRLNLELLFDTCKTDFALQL